MHLCVVLYLTKFGSRLAENNFGSLGLVLLFQGLEKNSGLKVVRVCRKRGISLPELSFACVDLDAVRARESWLMVSDACRWT